MEVTKDADYASQNSSWAVNFLTGPASYGASQVTTHPASSTVDHQDRSSATTSTVISPTKSFSPNNRDSNEGLIIVLTLLVSEYLFEILQAVKRYQGAASIPKVLEVLRVLKMFKLRNNGEGNLDQRLAGASRVRKGLVCNLTALAWDLSKGMTLYDPTQRWTLLQETKQLTCNPSTNIVKLLNKKCTQIKSRVGSLFRLLPTTDHLFETLDEVEPRPHAFEWPIAWWQAFTQRYFQISLWNMHKSDSSTASHGLEKSRTPHSSLAMSSTKTFSEHAYFPISSSVFSDADIQDDIIPTTDNNTSASYDIFPSEQPVVIWGRSSWGLFYQPVGYYQALFDSGTSVNFIVHWVAEELNLQTQPLHSDDVKAYGLIGGQEYLVSCSVQPTWRLHCGRRRYQEFRFFVVEALPNDLHLVVGDVASKEMGIHLRANKAALVAFPKKGKHSKIQEQPKHSKQLLDGCISRAQWQNTIAKTHSNVGKVSQNTNSQDQKSQKEAARQKDGQEKTSENPRS